MKSQKLIPSTPFSSPVALAQASSSLVRPEDKGNESLLPKPKDDNKEILFIRAEHVYCKVFYANGKSELRRTSLRRLYEELLSTNFEWVHRSYLVNLRKVTHWVDDQVFIYDVGIPISRGRRAGVTDRLREMSRLK